MKAGLITAGLVLMFLGGIGFLYIQQNLSYCESVIDKTNRLLSGEIQIDQFVSDDLSLMCSNLQHIQIGGALLFTIGMSLAIGGASIRTQSKEYVK